MLCSVLRDAAGGAGGDHRAGAERRGLRRSEQGVVTVDGVAGRQVRTLVPEQAAGSDLRVGLVVGEHEVRIDLRHLVHVVVREEAGGVAVVFPLDEVHRVEVVGVGGGVRDEGLAAVGVVDDIPLLAVRQGHGVEAAIGGVAGTDAAMQVVGDAARAGAGRDAAFAEVAGALEHRLDVAVGGVGGDVALVVRRVGADDDRHVVDAAVAADILGDRQAEAGQVLAGVAVALLVVVEAVLVVDLHAFEVLLHDEVDDAGDGVRAVHRRGAAGDHVDPVDQGRGDVVQVGDFRAGVARHQALAIDEDEGASRAEIAQVGGGGAVGAVGRALGLAGEGGGQVVDEGLDVRRAAEPDLGAGDRGQGADAGEVRLRDARAGDDQLLNRGAARAARGVGPRDRRSARHGAGGARGRGLGKGAGGDGGQGDAGDHRRGQQLRAGGRGFQVDSPPNTQKVAAGARSRSSDESIQPRSPLLTSMLTGDSANPENHVNNRSRH